MKDHLNEHFAALEKKIDEMGSLRRQFGVVTIREAADALRMSARAFYDFRIRNRIGSATHGQVRIRDIVRGLEREAEKSA